MADGGSSPIESCYSSERLDDKTWKVVEDDFQKGQYPFIYVISLPDRIVVIDSGCGGPEANPEVEEGSDNSANLFEFIDDLLKREDGGSPSESRPFHLYCTHYHFDHCGSNHVLCRQDSQSSANPRCGEVALSVHAKDAVLNGDPHDCSLARDHKVRLKPFGVTRWLADGDQIGLASANGMPTQTDKQEHTSSESGSPSSELETDAQSGNEVLEVLEIPGHTPDSVCFVDRARRRIFVGDFIYEWTPIYVSSKNSSLMEFQTSVTKLKAFCDRHRADDGIDFTLSGGHISAAMASDEALTALLGVANNAVDAVKSSDMSAATLVGVREGDDAKLYSFASDDGRFSLVVPYIESASEKDSSPPQTT